MAGERTLPGMGLTAYWNLGDNTWKPPMDNNLLVLSALLMPVALDFVAATPGSPTDGDIYLFDETHATHPNAVAIRDNGAWTYVDPGEGWLVYDVQNGVNRQFDGTIWDVLTTGGGGGGGAADGVGNLVKIASQTLVSAAASFDFTGIPSTYDDLVIVLSGRGDKAASFADTRLIFNNDTGANYDWDQMIANGNTSANGQAVAASFAALSWVPAATGAANLAASVQIEVPQYAKTTFFKDYMSRGGVRTGTGSTDIHVNIAWGLWRSTAAINRVTLLPDSGNFIAGTTATIYGRGGAIPNVPQQIPLLPAGRLTLVSGTPVQNTNETAKTAVYYTPYRGANVPIYSGTIWQNLIFSELTLTLNTSDNTSGSVYDVFVYNDAGVMKIGTGPAWTSTTARGTGAGTTELVRKDGMWTNAVAITLKNNGASVAGVPINTATYVGTIYCTANGQTGMNLNPAPTANGNGNVLGVFNAYNRVMTRAYSRDNSNVYSYSTATWRAANASNSNRVTFIDGLGEDMTKGAYQCNQNVGNTCSNSFFGCGFDSITAVPPVTASMNSCAFGNFSAPTINLQRGTLGLHYYQAMEIGSTSASFGGGAGGNQNSYVEFEGMM